MINFYKEDGIGKIAFASGDIYAPEGNVTVMLDATTHQVIVAEDNKIISYISISDTLQVNGADITGTDIEKLALIAPIFQNEGGETGTGSAGRFGVSGEDAAGTQPRLFDAGGNGVRIKNTRSFIIDTIDPFGSGNTLSFTIGQEGSWTWEDETADNSAKLFSGIFEKDGVAKPTSYLETNDFANNKKNGIYVDKDGIRATLQQFDSNADAVAALGVDKLYFGPDGSVKLSASEVAPSAPQLLSPDNTTWTLGITNEGTITATSGGTGGQASFTLTSPDNSVWTITINNEGVLSQTK